MLEFFRRHQRYFFTAITFVIVISFSFFGTSQNFQEPQVVDVVAFKAIDGTYIKQSEVDSMVLFLTMDPVEVSSSHRGGTLQFVQEAVLRKDILATGIGKILANTYAEELQEDILARSEKERTYKLYEHPRAQFLTTESIWSAYAPNLKNSYQELKSEANPLSEKALNARVELYLAEKQFPAPWLRYGLKSQEQQYPWLNPDENLDRSDLSLFGYHSIEDWFGPKFTRIAAEFVINTAKVAEKRGYRVSEAEALADLQRNAKIVFQQMLKSKNKIDVASSDEFFNAQLHRIGFDHADAAKTWRNVLLFQRLFQEAGNSVFVDALPFASFNTYADETAKGNLYELPEALQLRNFKEMQKFEIYLDAIARTDRKASLQLPQQYKSIGDISQKHPELVEKRYLVEIATIDKDTLLSKASMRETWKWELDAKNWTTLVREFPELGIKKSDDPDARFKALEALSPQRRSTVDTFARKALLAEHQSAWIAEALNDEAKETSVIGITLKGQGSTIEGVTDGASLIALLDEVQLSGAESDKSKDAAAKLAQYTADGKHYYAIKVIERLPNAEILTFKEANKRGILDAKLNAELEKYYAKERDKSTDVFQDENKSWKPFSDVKDEVAKRYFKNIIAAIRADRAENKNLSESALATKRLLPYVASIQQAMLKNPSTKDTYVENVETSPAEAKLVASLGLEQQWKLQSKSVAIAQKQKDFDISPDEALTMKSGSMTKPLALDSGAIMFFEKNDQHNQANLAYVKSSITKARELFFQEIQQTLATELIEEYKSQNAISVNYLEQGPSIGSEG